MPDTDNGRITLAVLGNELIHVKDEVQSLRVAIQAMRRELREYCTEQSTKIDAVEQWRATSAERWDGHKEQHDRESFVLKAFSTIVAVFTSTLAAIFAWLTDH